ncbi:glycerophosphodiester phosphodiesterase [Nitratiruptor sp. SB155-2]|uniref:glycerophosphodiester phosphodiesterase n=1 Tax=Nitratiruptor sp. (strain SB155-2) TaxID=387092 RepID=UPI0001586F99|nr:glycerophosphodiester phosphodiesterase [Nitratiruptor sp. SB155-2]BAF69622.1 glycerophosphoryl diester phosphodiesterase [Nitratiruptor sp. SB155-2]
MSLIKEKLSIKPFGIVAHRGGGEESVENTIRGIEYALSIGVDIVEVDIRSTKDGRLILLHDPDLTRIAGIMKEVHDVDFDELQKYKVFGKEPIATLKEALQTVDGKCGLFLEIKEPSLTDKVIQMVHAHDAKEWIAIISFYEEVIEQTKKNDPEIVAGLVYSRPPGKIKEAKAIGADFVLPHYKIATQKANRFAHALGLKVVAWTVNEESLMMECIEKGVDVIATDFPSMALELRRKMAEGRD